MSDDPTQVRIEGDDIVLTLPTDRTNNEYVMTPGLALQIGNALIEGAWHAERAVTADAILMAEDVAAALVDIRRSLQ